MPLSVKEKKDQKKAKERIFREFAEKDLSLSANEIIRRAKDKDVGIREKDAKAIIRGLKGVKKKEDVVIYTRVKYRTPEQKVTIKKILKRRKKERKEEVIKVVPIPFYYEHKVSALVEKLDERGKVVGRKNWLFYINSGHKLGKDQIKAYIKNVILRKGDSLEAWRLKRLNYVEITKKKYGEFEARILTLGRAEA